MSTLGSYLQVEDVLLGLQVTDKRQLFQAIGLHVQRIGGLAAEDVSSGLMRREQAGSTGLGLGVAVPHTRVKDLKHIRALYVRPSAGLLFDAPDLQPVFDVFVLLVPSPATQLHLELLAQVVSRFSEGAFRADLRERDDPFVIKQLFDRTT